MRDVALLPGCRMLDRMRCHEIQDGGVPLPGTPGLCHLGSHAIQDGVALQEEEAAVKVGCCEHSKFGDTISVTGMGRKVNGKGIGGGIQGVLMPPTYPGC